MSITRRESMAMALALALAGGSRSWAQTAADGGQASLDSLARRTGRRFGSTVGGGPKGALTGSFADPRYQALLAAECGVLVPENELKWGRIRPSAKTFDFEGADRLLAFAEEHGMAFRGHTLLWHHPRWTPRWVFSHDFGASPAAEAERMIRGHVAAVCRRYGTRIYSYDVVNETIDQETGAMRETPFSKHMGGESVVDLAFHAAREAAPHAQLVYNDYMSWGAGEKHRTGVLKLLEGFRKRGTPVHALGVQAHLSDRDLQARQESEWRRFLDVVVAMDYELVITELDVNDGTLAADVPARDRAVADISRAYLDLMLSYSQLGDILVWGMVDRFSWLQNRTPREDGLPKRPTPYDSEFRPKPMREAIAAALASAPTRYVGRWAAGATPAR